MSTFAFCIFVILGAHVLLLFAVLFTFFVVPVLCFCWTWLWTRLEWLSSAFERVTDAAWDWSNYWERRERDVRRSNPKPPHTEGP